MSSLLLDLILFVFFFEEKFLVHAINLNNAFGSFVFLLLWLFFFMYSESAGSHGSLAESPILLSLRGALTMPLVHTLYFLSKSVILTTALRAPTINTRTVACLKAALSWSLSTHCSWLRLQIKLFQSFCEWTLNSLGGWYST